MISLSHEDGGVAVVVVVVLVVVVGAVVVGAVVVLEFEFGFEETRLL